MFWVNKLAMTITIFHKLEVLGALQESINKCPKQLQLNALKSIELNKRQQNRLQMLFFIASYIDYIPEVEGLFILKGSS